MYRSIRTNSRRGVAKTAALAALLVFLGYHGVRIFMIGSGWGHDGTFGGAYRVDGSDGRSLLLVFVPKSMDLLIVYQSESDTEQCDSLATVQGTMPNRIAWRFWYNDFRGWPVLYADEPFVPVMLELTIGARSGRDCNGFAPAGSTHLTRVDFDGTRVRFQGMLLIRDANFRMERYVAQLEELRTQAVAAGYRSKR